MDEQLKTLVDESIKISVSATIHDLRKQGYELAQPELGDRVFLIDERIGLNEEVRVVDMTVTKNWKGEVIDLQLTFGSEGITKRYQSNLNTAVDRINDIFDGRKKIKMSFLDERVQEISNIINGNVDSVFEYTPNGVIGWNGDDPNYMTRYVGDAIGFSRDGGKTYNTAMSADLGINADYITYGHAKGFTMEAVEIYGSRFESRENDYTYTLIEGAYLESRGRYTNKWFGVTKEHDVAWKLNNGYLQAHTLNEEGMRLNYTGTGISTYIRGSNEDRKSTRLNSSHVAISYAVFCLKKKNTSTPHTTEQCCRPGN